MNFNFNFTDDFFEEFRFDDIERFESEFPFQNINRENRTKDDNHDGWGFPWPSIENGGRPHKHRWWDDLNGDCPCSDKNVMGYYLPWHYLMKETFMKGENYNDMHVIDNNNHKRNHSWRWGIHLCIGNIINYVDNRLMPQVGPYLSDFNQKAYFRDYAIYLKVISVVAHEWGHYRTEVLSLENKEALSNVMDDKQQLGRFAGNYLWYFDLNANTRGNFEEVFAEWCSLRYGVFNSKIVRPDNLPNIPMSESEKIKRDFLIRYGLLQAKRNNKPPYGDIERWIDFHELEKDKTIDSFVNKELKMSRVVGKLTFYKKRKMIDLMMHNINAFSKENIKLRKHGYLLSTSNPNHFDPSASIRPGVDLNTNPQVPSFNKLDYMNWSRSLLSCKQGIDLPSFRGVIHRLPMKELQYPSCGSLYS